MSELRRDVYFLVALPPELLVDVDLLGTHWPIPVAGVPCTLRLPRVSPRYRVDAEHWTDPETEALHPPDCSDLTAPADDSVASWLSVDPISPRWGMMRGYRGDDEDRRVARAELAQAVVTCPYEGADTDEARAEFFVRVGVEAGAWLDLLTGWLELLGRMVFRQPLGPRRLGGLPERWFVLSPTLRPGFTWAGEVRWVIPLEIGWSLTVRQWTLAARLADQREPLPLAHVLLRDARVAQHHDDGRRAVIDAATASEVALSTWLREHVSTSLDTDHARQFMRRRERGGGLMELYDFRVAVGGPVAGMSAELVSDRLAWLRNAVAHAGERPDRERVSAAIDVATALVDELAPLPREVPTA